MKLKQQWCCLKYKVVILGIRINKTDSKKYMTDGKKRDFSGQGSLLLLYIASK